MGRVAYITQLCLIALEDEGERKTTRDIIAYHMDGVQREIILRAHALKEKKSVTLRQGVTDYNVGDPVMNVLEVFPPTTWREKFHVTQSIEEWNERVRETWHRNPVLGIIWDGRTLELTPAPNTDGEILSLRVLPEPDTITASTDDPEIGRDFDDALQLGILAKVNPSYTQQYEAELSKQMALHLKTSGAGTLRMGSVFDGMDF